MQKNAVVAIAFLVLVLLALPLSAEQTAKQKDAAHLAVQIREAQDRLSALKEQEARAQAALEQAERAEAKATRVQDEKALPIAREAVVRARLAKEKIGKLLSEQAALAERLRTALAVLKEQDEFERMNAAWLQKQQESIRQAVEQDRKWTNEVLASIRAIRVPDPTHRPKTLNDLKPGDIILVHPEEGLPGTGSRLIQAADNFITGKETPASHALTFIGRAAGGQMMFLDQTFKTPTHPGGSHIIGEEEFRQRYIHRKMDVAAVAKPLTKEDGRKLFQAALQAVEKEKKHRGPGSTFGLFGKDLVCSEAAAVAVGKATGIEFKQPGTGSLRGLLRAVSPVDITPGDFYDEEGAGKYFIISPLMKK